MKRPVQSLADRLMAAHVAITNAISDEDVKTLIGELGYDDGRLNEGKTLLDKVNQLQQKQQKEYGDQFDATDKLQEIRANADKIYMRMIKVARVAFETEHALYQKLDLNGDRKRSVSGWLAQAKQFYINALEDRAVIEKMSVFGMTQAKLQEGKALVDQVELTKAAQAKEKGEAQQATLERDKALDALDSWMSQFIAISRIALEDKSQLMEKLGIVEPS